SQKQSALESFAVEGEGVGGGWGWAGGIHSNGAAQPPVTGEMTSTWSPGCSRCSAWRVAGIKLVFTATANGGLAPIAANKSATLAPSGSARAWPLTVRFMRQVPLVTERFPPSGQN